jgi:hypothetical protein
LANEGKQADLTAANNVLAHVPDINDFVAGFSVLLKPNGVATFEFPHLLNLITLNHFDTIYHEHFSYLSLTAVNTIFASNGLSIFDVEELSTHGGSLRVYAQRCDTGTHEIGQRVGSLLAREAEAGVASQSFYADFQRKTEKVKNDFIAFLLDIKKQQKKIFGYGAAAKGNTLLNYAGIRPDLLPYVVDRNPSKQNKFLPGCRIPILSEEEIRSSRPDYVLILPWNLREEVMDQLKYIRDWGGQFVTAVPSMNVY